MLGPSPLHFRKKTRLKKKSHVQRKKNEEEARGCGETVSFTETQKKCRQRKDEQHGDGFEHSSDSHQPICKFRFFCFVIGYTTFFIVSIFSPYTTDVKMCKLYQRAGFKFRRSSYSWIKFHSIEGVKTRSVSLNCVSSVVFSRMLHFLTTFKVGFFKLTKVNLKKQ